MKKKILSFFVLALVACAFLGGRNEVQAATVDGTEWYEVSWHGLPASDTSEKYHLYYGQTDTGKQENTIFSGLDNRSRSVRLSYLKPCTSYTWSLKGLRGGTWRWIIKNNAFSTGGTCPVATAATSGVQVIPGNASATATWVPTGGATSYNVYYKAKTDTKYVHAVRVPSNGTSVTINFLNPNVTYVYRVAALVDGKEVWQQEQVLQQAKSPVLGAITRKPSLNDSNPWR